MEKNLYIYYKDIEKLDRVGDMPISIVIDLLQYKTLFDIYENLEKMKQTLINKNLNIQNLFILTYYYKDIIDNIENIPYKTFASFADEENFRVEISELEDEQKEHIVGFTAVNSGVGIIFYKMIGVKNLFIESPLLNNEQNLHMLRDLGYVNLFATPNVMKFGGNQDPTWIRPEGITLYKKYINNFLLTDDEYVNINSVLEAYHNEQWLGKVSDIIIGAKENKFMSETLDLFGYDFDIKRMSCLADCHLCSRCDRAVNYINKLTSVFEKNESLSE